MIVAPTLTVCVPTTGLAHVIMPLVESIVMPCGPEIRTKMMLAFALFSAVTVYVYGTPSFPVSTAVEVIVTVGSFVLGT